MSPHEWIPQQALGEDSYRAVCACCGATKVVGFGVDGYRVSFRPAGGDWSQVTVAGCGSARLPTGWDANGSEVAR